jgi:hypothetical protein
MPSQAKDHWRLDFSDQPPVWSSLKQDSHFYVQIFQCWAVLTLLNFLEFFILILKMSF